MCLCAQIDEEQSGTCPAAKYKLSAAQDNKRNARQETHTAPLAADCHAGCVGWLGVEFHLEAGAGGIEVHLRRGGCDHVRNSER